MTQAATLTLTLQPVAGRHVFIPPGSSLQRRRLPDLPPALPTPLTFPAGYEPSSEVQPAPIALPHRMGLAVGVAIAATLGASVYQAQVPQLHEGRFELAPAPIAKSSEAGIAAAATADVRPEVDQATLIQVFRSQRLLQPTVRELRAHNITLSPAALAQDLEIVPLKDGRLEIRYRHRDAAIAETVSQELARTYTEYGRGCRLDACYALEQANSDVKEASAQVARLQQAIADFNARPNAQNLDQQVKALTTRTAEFTRYVAQTDQELSVARQRYQTLQGQVSLPSAHSFLQRQVGYQALLRDLHQVEGQIAAALAQAQPDSNTLNALYQRHQMVSSQLNQHMVAGFGQYVAAELPEVAAPASEDSMEIAADADNLARLSQVEQAFGLSHQINLLSARQRAIAPLLESLQSRKRQLAELIQYQTRLETQLTLQQRVLQESQHQQARLQQEVAQRRVVWQLVSPPEMVRG